MRLFTDRRGPACWTLESVTTQHRTLPTERDLAARPSPGLLPKLALLRESALGLGQWTSVVSTGNGSIPYPL